MHIHWLRKISRQPTLYCQVSHYATSVKTVLKCMHVCVYARTRRAKTRKWYYFFNGYKATMTVRPALKRILVEPHIFFQLFFYSFNTDITSENALWYTKIKRITVIVNMWFEISIYLNCLLIYYIYITYLHVQKKLLSYSKWD